MTISRRKTLLAALAFAGTFTAQRTAARMRIDLSRLIEEINDHIVPAQVRKTRVTHVRGVEHSFLQEEFRKFANMRNCKLIMQNAGTFNHPEWTNLPPRSEYLSLFVSAEHGPLDLSLEDVSAVVRGDKAVCAKLGLCGAALAAPRLGYRKNWSVQRYAQCLERVGIDAAVLFKNCTIVENYDQLSVKGRETPGQLLIGLGGNDFRGLLPVKVEGRSFDMRGAEIGYPLTQDVTMSVRHSDSGVTAFTDFVRIANQLAKIEIGAWEQVFATT